VPAAGRRDRPGLRSGDRRAAGRQRAIPAAVRPGGDRAGRGTDPARLEAACAKALAAGDPSYRTIKGILAAGAEAEALPAAAGDGGAAAFLHGPASFANIIPMPGTITSDAVHPAGAEEATS